MKLKFNLFVDSEFVILARSRSVKTMRGNHFLVILQLGTIGVTHKRRRPKKKSLHIMVSVIKICFKKKERIDHLVGKNVDWRYNKESENVGKYTKRRYD